jgi:hypothetical protein
MGVHIALEGLTRHDRDEMTQKAVAEVGIGKDQLGRKGGVFLAQ